LGISEQIGFGVSVKAQAERPVCAALWGRIKVCSARRHNLHVPYCIFDPVAVFNHAKNCD